MSQKTLNACPRVLALYHKAETFGGSFNSVVDVLSRIDPRRFEVHVGVPARGSCAEIFTSIGLPVHLLAEVPGDRSVRYARAIADAAVRLWWRRCALVYISDYVTWRSSMLFAAKLTGVASVVHVRSPIDHARKLDRALIEATVVVGNSEASVKAVRSRRPRNRTRVIHNFVDVGQFSYAVDRRESFFGRRTQVVGFLGIFRPENGIEYFLEMAQMVVQRRPGVRFLAVGGESAVAGIGWFPKMQAHARHLGVAPFVHFTGNREDVPDMMKSMDVLVVPSLNEGFGRVIIEANAVGVPAIGSNAAGIPEVIEDGVSGLLVPPRNSAALADAVVRFLDDQAWRDRLRRELPVRVRNRFSPESQMELIQQAWEDAIAYRSRA